MTIYFICFIAVFNTEVSFWRRLLFFNIIQFHYCSLLRSFLRHFAWWYPIFSDFYTKMMLRQYYKLKLGTRVKYLLVFWGEGHCSGLLEPFTTLAFGSALGLGDGRFSLFRQNTKSIWRLWNGIALFISEQYKLYCSNTFVSLDID